MNLDQPRFLEAELNSVPETVSAPLKVIPGATAVAGWVVLRARSGAGCDATALRTAPLLQPHVYQYHGWEPNVRFRALFMM